MSKAKKSAYINHKSKIWIVVHSHRHGLDVWPVLSESQPDIDAIAESDPDQFELERDDERLEVQGPFLLNKIVKP